MSNWFKDQWNAFIEFNKSRLWPGMLSHTKEDYERNFNIQFDGAKRLSDFIGMIIRWAFAIGAAGYFAGHLKDTGWERFVFGICFFFTSLIAFYMGVRIMILLWMYWASDVHKNPSRAAKIGLMIFAFMQALALYYGLTRLVSDLAKKAI